MPRQSRLDSPGALHHIIARGNERRKIFADQKDCKEFLIRLGDILSGTETICYAWAILPNHFHLFLRTGTFPIATIMRRLLTGYAIYFNRRHRRYGHLFQNRYKSILCQEDPYFQELVRYIHLNPLRANLHIEALPFKRVNRVISSFQSLTHYKYRPIALTISHQFRPKCKNIKDQWP